MIVVFRCPPVPQGLIYGQDFMQGFGMHGVYGRRPGTHQRAGMGTVRSESCSPRVPPGAVPV